MANKQRQHDVEHRAGECSKDKLPCDVGQGTKFTDRDRQESFFQKLL